MTDTADHPPFRSSHCTGNGPAARTATEGVDRQHARIGPTPADTPWVAGTVLATRGVREATDRSRR